LLVVEAAVMADGQRQTINQGNAAGMTQTRLPVGRSRDEHGGQALDPALLTDQIGKRGGPMTADLLAIAMLEAAVIGIVKRNDQPPDLAHRQTAGATARPTRGGQ
jgi:hypothetical protein